jgi:transcription factor E
MLNKFLEEVVILTVGKQAKEIAELLNSPKHVNEFTIAKKMDITINYTRNILYRISDHGLVSYIRKKDKKKGWYTYFWKFEILKALKFLKKILKKREEQLNNQLKSRETKQFYLCKKCNVEFNQENALVNDFSCNECGDIMDLKDNAKEIKSLKRELSGLTKQKELINIEIQKEEEKIEKIKLKQLKKQGKLLKKTPLKKKSTKAVKKPVKKKVVKKKPVKKKVVKKPVKKKVVKKKVVKKKPVKSKKTFSFKKFVKKKLSRKR